MPRAHARLLMFAMVVGCGGGATTPDGTPDGAVAASDAPPAAAWLPTSWPTTLPDPVAAAERVFELVDGRWRLDFAGVTPDTPCEALDCPGGADGWDPTLAAQGAGDYDVVAYAAAVHPSTLLWRELDAWKSVVDAETSIGFGFGEVTTFYARSLDGSLLAVRGNTQLGLNGPDDFWRVAFADAGDRIQLATADPFGNVAGTRFEIQPAPAAIVVAGASFAFRAARADPPEPDDSLDAAYADLEGAPTAARAIELVELARTHKDAGRGLLARILHLADRPEAALRAAVVRYALESYPWSWNALERVIQADPLVTRLLRDPEPAIRAQVADGFAGLWADPDLPYHCAVDWAVHECVAHDPAPSVVAACQAVVDLGRTPYGYCPWLSGW